MGRIILFVVSFGASAERKSAYITDLMIEWTWTNFYKSHGKLDHGPLTKIPQSVPGYPVTFKNKYLIEFFMLNGDKAKCSLCKVPMRDTDFSRMMWRISYCL